MAVEAGTILTIDGTPEWRVDRLTVVEASTPLTVGDMTGGVGQITFDMPNVDGAKARVHRKPIRVQHPRRGAVTGTVSGFGGNRSTVAVDAMSTLGSLNVERTMPPYHGTLGGLITMLLTLCGVPTADLTVEADVSKIPKIGRASCRERVL